MVVPAINGKRPKQAECSHLKRESVYCIYWRAQQQTTRVIRNSSWTISRKFQIVYLCWRSNFKHCGHRGSCTQKSKITRPLWICIHQHAAMKMQMVCGIQTEITQTNTWNRIIVSTSTDETYKYFPRSRQKCEYCLHYALRILSANGCSWKKSATMQLDATDVRSGCWIRWGASFGD